MARFTLATDIYSQRKHWGVKKRFSQTNVVYLAQEYFADYIRQTMQYVIIFANYQVIPHKNIVWQKHDNSMK